LTFDGYLALWGPWEGTDRKGGKDDASAQREGLRGLGGTGLIRRMTRMLALR